MRNSKRVSLEKIILIFSNEKKLTLKGKKLDEFLQKIEEISQFSDSKNFWDFLREGDDEKK
ncbi:MAG: hypothetical protein NTZ42_01520 [Candidatus Gribaldobacteria bacterium]|nr:hypothetical protein [Candidatus Gribaldobacteria bacterium]